MRYKAELHSSLSDTRYTICGMRRPTVIFEAPPTRLNQRSRNVQKLIGFPRWRSHVQSSGCRWTTLIPFASLEQSTGTLVSYKEYCLRSGGGKWGGFATTNDKIPLVRPPRVRCRRRDVFSGSPGIAESFHKLVRSALYR
jgi:hypothetical protein